MKYLNKILLVISICAFILPAQQAPKGMVKISGGTYKPLYSKNEEVRKVGSFFMDIYPVTNGEFLEFVKANPQWQRSKVKHLFADHLYLHHWKGDVELGENTDCKSPVTNVSWFASKAYAEWKGKRLPTVDEWEYTASASRTKKDGTNDTSITRRILGWYSKLSSKTIAHVGSTEKNYWGVYDLFGLVWEWTYDFNNALVTGESRGDSNLERNLFCGNSSSGAGNVNDYPAFMRYGFRSSLKANYTVSNLGFRCVKDLNNKKEDL